MCYKNSKSKYRRSRRPICRICIPRGSRAPDKLIRHRAWWSGAEYVGSVRTNCTSKSVLGMASRKVSRTYKALCRTHASPGSAGGGDRRESVGGHGDRPSGEGREHGCLKVPTKTIIKNERQGRRPRAVSFVSRSLADKFVGFGVKIINIGAGENANRNLTSLT